MDPVKFTTATYKNDELDFYAIIPDDHTNGFIIGEMKDVVSVYQALKRLVEDGKVDEQIHHLDERLGHRWLTIPEASEKFNIPSRTIRKACTDGRISLAENPTGGGWRFPQRYFLAWARNYHPRPNARS